MNCAYPLLLDVTDRLVVIVGGGTVAVRKASGLIAAGAKKVRCISLRFSSDLPASVERIEERYESRHLAGAQLVFAATDDQKVNTSVVLDARHQGIPVNRADQDETDPGDFITPARMDFGPVIVTVSAGSAALSAVIRDDLAAKVDRRMVAMAEAMTTLRPLVRNSGLLIDRRAAVFRELTSDQALNTLDTGGIEALRSWLLTRYPELSHG